MKKQKEIKDMTKKELELEYQSVCEQIECLSFGRWELSYRSQLEREIDKRGYEVRTNYSIA